MVFRHAVVALSELLLLRCVCVVSLRPSVVSSCPILELLRLRLRLKLRLKLRLRLLMLMLLLLMLLMLLMLLLLLLLMQILDCILYVFFSSVHSH